MNNKRIMLVEDDPFISDDLRRILSKAGYLVVAIADHPDDAITLIEEKRPDLVLLDINLNTAVDGVDVAHRIRSTTGIPFIFITANIDDQTLSRVAYTEPQGFISKPYHEADVLIGVQLALVRTQNQPHKEQPSTGFEKVQFVKSNLGLEKIEVDEILYLEANDYYCFLHLQDRKILVTTTMGQLEQQLKLPFLVKIHRSHYVNINKVNKIVGNQLEVNGINLPISRTHKEEFLKKVEVL